uniref:Replication protein E1 n=1 Tax=Human papillomavirus type 26 TaxID=333762 RepID=A0A219KX79_HPV26|nr:early protein E1 [Human papillomavirus type 26]
MDCEGTNEEGRGCTGWFSVEAIVEKHTGDTISDDETDNSSDTGSDLIGFIDDSSISDYAEQEVTQALFQAQQKQANTKAVRNLKRKLLGSQNSPLQDITNQHRQQSDSQQNTHQVNNSQAKRRAVDSVPDSGYGYTEVETLTPVQVDKQYEENGGLPSVCSQGGSNASVEDIDVDTHVNSVTQICELLKCSNVKAALLSKFKTVYGVSFAELVRVFKSDKTCCSDWVCAAFGVAGSVAESIKSLIQQYCLYYHIQCLTCNWGVIVLMLVRFTCAKNRTTIKNCLCMLLNVPETQLLIEPPKLRSTAVALYFYKTGLSNISETYGETPEWIVRQTQLEHSFDDATFDLSKMVQWAFDHDITDDSEIAFKYAQLADIDSNAAAFLKSNCQAKYVKDCATMTRHYKRAQKRSMCMSQWLQYRCSKIEEGGSWKEIAKFLRFQHVNFIYFLQVLKQFLKGTPKHNCIVIYGPPNTGKSQFAMSFIKFMQGSVISYVNSNSHFWLQPLEDAKVAVLDDATYSCWLYIDKYLRNFLDGNPCCIDRKHRSLLQVTCPPLIITSNINPQEDNSLLYLHSRVTVIPFPNTFPFDSNGNPVYALTDVNWKSFFSTTWSRLDLEEDADKENGEPLPAFKCVPGENTRLL